MLNKKYAYRLEFMMVTGILVILVLMLITFWQPLSMFVPSLMMG